MITVSTLESLPVKKKRKKIKGKDCRLRQHGEPGYEGCCQEKTLEKANRNQEPIGSLQGMNICHVTPSLFSSNSRYGGKCENFSEDTTAWYRERRGGVNEYLELRRTVSIANPLGVPDGQAGVFICQAVHRCEDMALPICRHP